MLRLSARKISVGVSCRQLVGIGRAGRAYVSSSQPDVKVVSAASVGSEQHASEPPPQPSKRGGGVLWKLIGLSIVGAGGAVGYCWYDENFRKSVEDRVPYAKQVFDNIFEYLPAPKSTQPVPLPPTKHPQPVKESKSTSAVKHESEQKTTATDEPAAQKSVPSKEEAEETELKQSKLKEKERRDQAVKLRETEEAAENTDLEGLLEKLLSSARNSVAAAVATLMSAASMVQEHTEQIRRAMEISGRTDDWRQAHSMRPLQSEVILMSDSAAQFAKSDLDQLRSAVTDARSRKSTQKNQALLPTEDELSKLNYDLSLAVSKLNKAKSEEKIVLDYRGRVKQGRDQFRKELESVVPDVKIGPRLDEGQLSADELNSLIAHAHRRIEQLEKQLAEQRTAEQQRVNTALGQLRDENQSLAEERLTHEKEQMHAELERLKRQWVEESEVERERELRSRLSRQAAAHDDHVKEVLRVQQHELQTAFDVRLAGLVDRERVALQQKVAGWTGRMHGIDKALADRAEMDKTARRAQELWLACQTLHSVITDGDPDAKGAAAWEDRLRPLRPELDAITAALSESSELVSTVVGAVPETAVSRGVWTEAALAERFARVRSVARRVALVDESSGGSLFRYLVSYVMSVFVVRTHAEAAARPDDDDSEELDADELTVFELVDRAADALERGNLDQAVRYVNQLRGESRRVASDWLTEARLLLETRQAAEVLVSFAVANSLGSLA